MGALCQRPGMLPALPGGLVAMLPWRLFDFNFEFFIFHFSF
jgi:hypothetical protein